MKISHPELTTGLTKTTDRTLTIFNSHGVGVGEALMLFGNNLYIIPIIDLIRALFFSSKKVSKYLVGVMCQV